MNDLLPHLAMSVNWYEWEIKVFLRANGHCEYCDKDMTASSDAFYYDRPFDHIRPDEGNCIENMAVACKACNLIKRDQWFAGESRIEIIANARTYTRSIRDRNNRRLAIDMAFFRSTQHAEKANG